MSCHVGHYVHHHVAGGYDSHCIAPCRHLWVGECGVVLGQSYHSPVLRLLLVTHIPIFILKIHVCATRELQCSREERGKRV